MDLASLRKTIHDRRPKGKFVNLASKIVFACLTISFGLIFTYNYFLYTHEYPPGSYERIAAYEADKVFQTRFLITALANFLIPLIPIFDSFFGWMIPYPMSYEVVLQMINTLFLAGLLMLMPKLMKALDCSVNPFGLFSPSFQFPGTTFSSMDTLTERDCIIPMISRPLLSLL